MKNFYFDIQRFNELATISFGNGTASISSGITVTDETIAVGSNNDDSLITSDFLSDGLTSLYVSFNSDGLISVGGGSDQISILGGISAKEYQSVRGIRRSNVTIDVGEDSDIINISGYSNTGIGYTNFLLNGGSEYDQISISSSSQTAISESTGTIKGGEGNDTISIYAPVIESSAIVRSEVLIDGENGNDQIQFSDGLNSNLYNISNATVTVNGDSGNDVISVPDGIYATKISISGGDDFDTILIGSVMSDNDVTIDGGESDDTINVGNNGYGIIASTVSINGGNGSDKILVGTIDSLSGVSIVAGGGDNINVGSGVANYLFDSTNEVTINGATFTANTAGTYAELVSYTEGTSIGSAWNGNVALSGTNSLADLAGNIVSAAGNYQIINGTLASSNDISTVTPITTDTDTIVTSGWATITNAEISTVIADSINTAYGTVNDDTIQVSTINSAYSVYGNGGKDFINIEAGDGGTVYGSTDNDTIYSLGDHMLILAGDGNNSIQNGDMSNNQYGFYSGIVAGIGNDTIFNYGYDVTIDSGSGDDYVLSDVRSDAEFYRSATIYSGAGSDTVVVNDNETSVNGGSDNDYISINGGSSAWYGHTLQGGTGDDVIHGGKSNVFLYTEGDGNDTIYNFADGDTLQVVSSQDYSSIVSGNDILINIGDGSLLLVGAVGKTINVYNGYDITIDLNMADSSTGLFVVYGTSLPSGDIAIDTTAKFQNAHDTTSTLVGTVNSDKIYISDTNNGYRQTVIIPEGWNVTATNNDDVLNINGTNVTVTGGEGNDTFNLSSDAKVVTITDLNIFEDKLSFGNYIEPYSMNQILEEDHLVLTADDLRIDLPGMSEMTEEFLDYKVSNAGNSSTIRELLYGSTDTPNTFISFAHWTFGFNSSSEGDFFSQHNI